jgi:hypothetical protein
MKKSSLYLSRYLSRYLFRRAAHRRALFHLRACGYRRSTSRQILPSAPATPYRAIASSSNWIAFEPSCLNLPDPTSLGRIASERLPMFRDRAF